MINDCNLQRFVTQHLHTEQKVKSRWLICWTCEKEYLFF